MAGWGISCEIALGWLSLDQTEVRSPGKPSHHLNQWSPLVQVMAWCHHYLSQYWPSSMLPYDITRPQWVKHFSLYPIFVWNLDGGYCTNFLHMFILSVFKIIITNIVYLSYITIIFGKHLVSLTHLPLDKIATTVQTTFSNAFTWMKIFVFRFKCH